MGRDESLRRTVPVLVLGSCLLFASLCAAQSKGPELRTIFPAGGRAGETLEVRVTGSGLTSAALISSAPGFQCERIEADRFRLTLPPDLMPGLYDVWASGPEGVSGPRSIFVGNRLEVVETESNDTWETAAEVGVNTVVNGAIDGGGDRDCYQFAAKLGQCIVIECWAERIESRLRPVLEIFDERGKRLAVNRGFFGIDALIAFHVPEDGKYIVRVEDLVSSGSAEHYYRLDVDTGPRVVTTHPSVVRRGHASLVTLYGWNLHPAESRAASRIGNALDTLEVEIPAAMAEAQWPLPMRQLAPAAAFDAFPYHLPGSHASVPIGISDQPIVVAESDHGSWQSARPITCPCEVSGRLAEPQQQDWYSLHARRGEVFYIEAAGERIGSPVDLDISIFDSPGDTPLAEFHDDVENTGGVRLPTNHLDPSGRWVSPADGEYFICVRNLSADSQTDPRRIYRLSVRREEPDFQLLAVPAPQASGGLNVQRGGRAILEIIALRQRGCTGSIRVAAQDLPAGIECPDVWLGPGVSRTIMVVSASATASTGIHTLRLEGSLEAHGPIGIRRAVKAATLVRSSSPVPAARLISEIPLAVTGDAPITITANGHEPLEHHLYGTLQVAHAPGGILDVAVTVDRPDNSAPSPIQLIGMGVPAGIENQTAIIPAGESRGYLSFYLPPTLPVGNYSLAIQATTHVAGSDAKPTPLVAYSDTVSFDVRPAAFQVDIDAFAPKIARRGDVLQIAYNVQRKNGFIGKVHTEIACPGCVTDVPGLLARGETFVGRTDTGSLQLIVNPDAALGPQRFLRLFTVGVVEDQPVYFGARFLPLEITE